LTITENNIVKRKPKYILLPTADKAETKITTSIKEKQLLVHQLKNNKSITKIPTPR